jgi:choline monooxygenase
MSDKINLVDFEIKNIEFSETLPSLIYKDINYHKFELDNIISKTWQYICSTEELKNKGDYITSKVSNNPIIISNDENNVIRAFYNVCNHRAGPIALKNGNSNVLKCKYHGWTYSHQGNLIGVPEFEGVKNFDKNNCGLKSIKLDIWENLIFINLSENPIPLIDYLKGIKERINPIDLKNKKFYKRITYNIKCNWKVYVDNYLEGYHLTQVHPELSELLDYKNYITETNKFYSLQYSPFKKGENLYKSNDGEAYYYFVYPNFMLNILPNRLQTNLVIPETFNSTKVIFDYYYDDIDSEESKKMIIEDLNYSDIIQQQDIEICEHVQNGIESDIYKKGRLSVKRELGLYHFQNLIRDDYLRNYKTLTSNVII